MDVYYSFVFLSKSWKLGWVKIEFLFPLLLYYTRVDRFYESFGNDSFGIYRFELVDWKMEECVFYSKIEWSFFWILQTMIKFHRFFFNVSLLIFGKMISIQTCEH